MHALTRPQPTTAGLLEGQTRAQQVQKYVAGALLVLFAARSIWFVLTPFRMGGNPLGYFNDDFFYYLIVAKNIATGHGSTFNGIVPTNGYQPLWEAILTGEQLFSPSLAITQAFVSGVSLVAGGLTVWLSWRLFKSFALSDLAAAIAAVFIGRISLDLYVGGMEVVLAIPLMLWLLVLVRENMFRTPGRLFGLGLVLSIAALARLDVAIFGALLLVLQLFDGRPSLGWKNFFGFFLGLLPLAGYFAFNQVTFGSVLPISGVAKQLKSTMAPSSATLLSALHNGPFYVALLVLSIIGALAVLILKQLSLSRSERLLLFAALAYPLAYYGILSVRSDWAIWPWYFYPLPPAMVALICASKRPIGLLQTNPLVLGLVMLALGLKLVRGTEYQMEATIPDEAVAISKFASAHHAIYAMGDRAGSVAYLLHNPMIQTEGLVMDKKFLENVKLRRPLLSVLRSYKVRYYIVSYHRAIPSPFSAVEPFQAGKSSPTMRGVLYHAPVFRFDKSGYHTAIYDLSLEKSS